MVDKFTTGLTSALAFAPIRLAPLFPLLLPTIFQPQQKMAESDPQGADYEEEHVHSVYEQIASHFSSTRYKLCVIQRLAPLAYD